MEKRYQVFVSSTYEDLQRERQEVMHALLELNCLPSGMELFPAADEDKWSLIKQVIDECDYYIVIIGGRYGSLGEDGTSYTESEYSYALEIGKPIIAFLHKDPSSLPAEKRENDEKIQKKLADFRALAEKKMCKYWTTAENLGSVVSRSLINLIRKHPGIGWVRADQLPDENALEEILRLRRKLEELENELTSVQTGPPKGSEDLAQEADEYEIQYKCSARDKKNSPWTLTRSFKMSWDLIFYLISPLLIEETSESDIKACMEEFIQSKVMRELEKEKEGWNRVQNLKIIPVFFDTIKVQLRALGLIKKGIKKRSVKDTNRYWTLTPHGDQIMTMLRARRKDES